MLGKSSCPLQGCDVPGRAKGVALIANVTKQMHLLLEAAPASCVILAAHISYQLWLYLNVDLIAVATLLDAGEEEHVLMSYFSSRAVRRLIVASSHHASGDGAITDFPALLWEAALKGRCQQWLGTHAEKILAALATCNHSKISKAMEVELQPILGKSVEQWAADFVQHGSEVSKLPTKKGIKKHSVSQF